MTTDIISQTASRRAWSGKVIPLGMLAIACATAFSLGVAAKRESNANRGLAVPENALNIGTVWETKAFEWVLPIKNRSAEDIEILDFSASCGCTSIEPKSVTVPAQQTVDVRLKIDLFTRNYWEMDKSLRPLSIRIIPRTSSPENEQHPGWTIAGAIRSRITLDQPRVHFPETITRGQRPTAYVVRATSHVPARAIVAQYEPAIISVAILRADATSDHFSLHIVPSDGLPAGYFAFDIPLHVITPDGQTLEGPTIAVDGSMQEDIQAIPDRILLGAKPIGSVVTENIVLRSVTGKIVQVAGFSEGSGDITTSPAGTTIGGASAFTISQRIAAPGDHSSTLTFAVVTKDDDATTLTVPVEVQYRGVPISQLTQP